MAADLAAAIVGFCRTAVGNRDGRDAQHMWPRRCFGGSSFPAVLCARPQHTHTQAQANHLCWTPSLRGPRSPSLCCGSPSLSLRFPVAVLSRLSLCLVCIGAPLARAFSDAGDATLWTAHRHARRRRGHWTARRWRRTFCGQAATTSSARVTTWPSLTVSQATHRADRSYVLPTPHSLTYRVRADLWSPTPLGDPRDPRDPRQISSASTRPTKPAWWQPPRHPRP